LRIDVIVNTTARHFRGSSLLDDVLATCAGRADLHPTSSLAELDEVCALLAERGTDLCALAGGDGSFMAGTTALARAFGERRLPRLALVPGGTAATVARNWVSSRGALETLRRLFAAGDALGFSRRPTLRVRELARAGDSAAAASSAGDAERIGFIFGTGLVARFFEEYYARGARGYSGAAAIVARVFAESFVGGAYARKILDPLPCTVEAEGRRLAPEAWSLVCASVVPDLGIHMMVTYRAGEDLARPHLVASALPPRALGPRAPLVLLGKRIGGEGHFDDLVESFVVRFPEAGDGRGPYVLDGDMLRAAAVEVTAGPPVDVAIV
jgi:diacylglycerol kinase (ATP)